MLLKVDGGADKFTAGRTVELVKRTVNQRKVARRCRYGNRLYIERLPTNHVAVRVHRPSNRGFRADSNIPFGLHSILQIYKETSSYTALERRLRLPLNFEVALGVSL